MNALENRVVSVSIIKGAYLNVLLNKFLHTKFEGKLVKIISKINSEYAKCIIKEMREMSYI